MSFALSVGAECRGLGLLAGFVIHSFEVAVLEFVRLLIPVTCLGGAWLPPSNRRTLVVWCVCLCSILHISVGLYVPYFTRIQMGIPTCSLSWFFPQLWSVRTTNFVKVGDFILHCICTSRYIVQQFSVKIFIFLLRTGTGMEFLFWNWWCNLELDYFRYEPILIFCPSNIFWRKNYLLSHWVLVAYVLLYF